MNCWKDIRRQDFGELYEEVMSCIEKANEIEYKELRLDMLKLAMATLFTILRKGIEQ